MKIKILKLEDRELLSDYLLNLGYSCNTSEGNLDGDLPEELKKQIEELTPESLYELDFVKNKLAEEALEEQLEKEDRKIKLERVIANESVAQAVKNVAQAKLDKLNGGK